MTKNCYFRLTTSKIGIDVTDTLHLMSFHSLFPQGVCQMYSENHGTIPVKSFAGSLAAQLLRMADIEDEEERMRQERSSWNLHLSSSGESEGIETVSTEDGDQDKDEMDEQDNSFTDITYSTPAGKCINKCTSIKLFKDGNGGRHTLAKFPVVQTGKNKKKRARVQSCSICSKETTMFCMECGEAFCYSYGGNGHGRKCFQHHVPTRTCIRIATAT